VTSDDISKQIISFDITEQESLRPEPANHANDSSILDVASDDDHQPRQQRLSPLRKVMLGREFSDSPLKDYTKKASPEKMPCKDEFDKKDIDTLVKEINRLYDQVNSLTSSQ
jgi:hypothetical protein